MTEQHNPLPVAGYTAQSKTAVDMVNEHKIFEEQLLRRLDALADTKLCDPRWLAIARTELEKAFMSLNRAVFKPQRIKLPGDEAAPTDKA